VKFQGVDVCLDPVLHVLIASCFRVGVRTGPQHENKQRCRPRLPGRRVIDRDRSSAQSTNIFSPALCSWRSRCWSHLGHSISKGVDPAHIARRNRVPTFGADVSSDAMTSARFISCFDGISRA